MFNAACATVTTPVFINARAFGFDSFRLCEDTNENEKLKQTSQVLIIAFCLKMEVVLLIDTLTGRDTSMQE